MTEYEELPEKEIPCNTCQKPIRYTPVILFGQERLAPVKCDDCIDASQREQERIKAEKALEALQARWCLICPPLYQNTDLGRIPAKYAAIVNGWKASPIAPAFIGEAGSLKTRSAFELLKRFHFQGVHVEAISATKFAKVAADQFDDDKNIRTLMRTRLLAIHDCDFLLLDDLGKQKMSERAEIELYDLLEDRTSNQLPTMWTANSNGAELLSMFSKDRGEPILRRLAEFSTVVKEAGQ